MSMECHHFNPKLNYRGIDVIVNQLYHIVLLLVSECGDRFLMHSVDTFVTHIPVLCFDLFVQFDFVTILINVRSINENFITNSETRKRNKPSIFDCLQYNRIDSYEFNRSRRIVNIWYYSIDLYEKITVSAVFSIFFLANFETSAK